MRIKLPLRRAVVFAFVLVITATSVFPQAQGGFVVPITGDVGSIAVQPDGKMIVIVEETRNFPVNGRERKMIRFSPDGTRDLSFTGPTGFWPCPPLCSAPVWGVWALPDGKLFAAIPSADHPLRRLNSDGSNDTAFDPFIKVELNPTPDGAAVNQMFTLQNAQMYIAGRFDTVNGVRMSGVARLNADGTIDTAFADPLLDGLTSRIAIQPDGKLVISGSFTNVGGTARPYLARLNPNGALDTSFTAPWTSSSSVQISSMHGLSDGKIIIAGTFSLNVGQQSYSHLARLNQDGSVDTTFNLAIEDRPLSGVHSTLIQPDGKIVVRSAFDRFAPFGSEDYTRHLVKRFNPDGSRDNSIQPISVVRNSTGGPLALQPDGGILTGHRGIGRIGPDGKLDVPFARFDYNGDKRADLAVFRPSNRTWYIHTGNTYSVLGFGVGTDRPVAADFDGDAKTDIAVYRESNGTWYWINSSTITYSYQKWGEPGDIAWPGMSVASRRAVFDVYRPSNGTWYRLAVNNGFGTISRTTLGGVGNSVPVPFHAVSMASTLPSVFETSDSGLVFTRRELGSEASPTLVTFGQAGDQPVSADFDGDLNSDLAVYRPATGQWTIRLSGTNTNIFPVWGEPGDIPVPADYDGDLKDDLAVYRPSTGTWYIICSTEGWRIQQFGAPGDIPIPGAYIYGLQ